MILVYSKIFNGEISKENIVEIVKNNLISEINNLQKKYPIEFKFKKELIGYNILELESINLMFKNQIKLLKESKREGTYGRTN